MPHTATGTGSTGVRFVNPDELGSLPMHESGWLRIRHHLEQRELPYLG
jgi:hypothetical protein